MTYKEFLEKHGINYLRYISFTNENTSLLNITILDNPSKYIDVAKEAKKLQFILVPKVESKEYYDELKKFVENCRDSVTVKHDFLGIATRDEFIKGEEIINIVLKEINPNWNIKQKLAYVHYKMGKLVSYVPDYNFNKKSTNSPNIIGAKNIWKSLSDGKSICNGITAIERNILYRLGIKTTELSSGIHSYLLTETEEGNIITDATWDLTSSLYEAKPNYFGVTYEELCEQERGIANSHRLKNVPENVIKIDEDELREIYYSIGITGEDRKFPLPILEKTRDINSKKYSSIENKLDAFLKMFIIEFSNEAAHLSETRNILQQCLEELGIEESTINTKFVYTKNDMKCINPFLMIHIDNENMEDRVYILNGDAARIENMNIQEFDKMYRLHIYDTSIPFWKKYIKSHDNKEKVKTLYDNY